MLSNSRSTHTFIFSQLYVMQRGDKPRKELTFRPRIVSVGQPPQDEVSLSSESSSPPPVVLAQLHRRGGLKASSKISIGQKRPRSDGLRVTRVQSPNSPTEQDNEASGSNGEDSSLRTQRFVDRLQQQVLHVFLSTSNSSLQEKVPEAVCGSTEVTLGGDDSEADENPPPALHPIVWMNDEERHASLEKIKKDLAASESRFFHSQQRFLTQADEMVISEVQLLEKKLLDELFEQTRAKQIECFDSRVNHLRERRHEESLKWETFRNHQKTQEELEIMMKHNRAMSHMRKIIESKRNLFSQWLKVLEKRQMEERRLLLESQRRQKKSRLSLFASRSQDMQDVEMQKIMQKEFNIEEQHHKMMNLKMLSHLDQLQKIHHTFCVRKFEVEIHLLEGEQFLTMEHQKELYELFLSQQSILMDKIIVVESLKFELEESVLRIGHLQVLQKLLIDRKKHLEEVIELHGQQRQNTSVFDCGIFSANSAEEVGSRPSPLTRMKETESDLNHGAHTSIWSSVLASDFSLSFAQLDSMIVSLTRVSSLGLNDSTSSGTGTGSGLDSESISETSSDNDLPSLDSDDSNLKRQILRERRRLLHFRHDMNRLLQEIEQCKITFGTTFRELGSKHESEIVRYNSEKVELLGDVLLAKEKSLQEAIMQHSREKIGLANLHIKELENFRDLQAKEIDLRKKAEEMRVVMEAMLDPMIVADQFGRIISVNDAACDIFGYQKSEMIGRNVSMIADEKIAVEHDSYLKNYRETKQPKIIGTAGREVYGRSKTGQRISLHLSVSEGQVDGKPVFVACLHDLSETKHRELQLQEARDNAALASQAKSRFLAQMSHELRTPLHAMLGFSELLEDSNLSPIQKDMTLSIRECGNSLLSILSDVISGWFVLSDMDRS